MYSPILTFQLKTVRGAVCIKSQITAIIHAVLFIRWLILIHVWIKSIYRYFNHNNQIVENGLVCNNTQVNEVIDDIKSIIIKTATDANMVKKKIRKNAL